MELGRGYWRRRFYCFAAVPILCLSQIACGQAVRPSVSKAQAMKDVKAPIIAGWHEAISDEGRFRILFPGQPRADAEVRSMKGFKFFAAEANWFAYYTDFDQPRASDDAHLRSAYNDSVEDITKNGKQLLSQKDVFLNGRLGSEFIIEAPGTVSYMRAYLFGRRMYTLAVDRKRVANGDATIPNDVQQFFESFTYWDIS